MKGLMCSLVCALYVYCTCPTEIVLATMLHCIYPFCAVIIQFFWMNLYSGHFFVVLSFYCSLRVVDREATAGRQRGSLVAPYLALARHYYFMWGRDKYQESEHFIEQVLQVEAITHIW